MIEKKRDESIAFLFASNCAFMGGDTFIWNIAFSDACASVMGCHS
jgi:hypothetical protein